MNSGAKQAAGHTTIRRRTKMLNGHLRPNLGVGPADQWAQAEKQLNQSLKEDHLNVIRIPRSRHFHDISISYVKPIPCSYYDSSMYHSRPVSSP